MKQRYSLLYFPQPQNSHVVTNLGSFPINSVWKPKALLAPSALPVTFSCRVKGKNPKTLCLDGTQIMRSQKVESLSSNTPPYISIFRWNKVKTREGSFIFISFRGSPSNS